MPRIARLRGGPPTLTLLHTGRRNGETRESELPFLADGDNAVVVAARGGSDLNPSWLLNLRAAPAAEVKSGLRKRPVRAREADGDERARLWPRLVETMPELDGLQAKTERVFPVVVLEPVQ